MLIRGLLVALIVTTVLIHIGINVVFEHGRPSSDAAVAQRDHDVIADEGANIDIDSIGRHVEQAAPPAPPVAEAGEQDSSLRDLLLDTLVFIQRKELMGEMCSKYGHLHRNVFYDTKDLDHILVDEKHQMLYCYVPKVACTNWKRVFLALMGRMSGDNVSTIPAELVHRKATFAKLSDYSVDQARLFVDTFTKFVFVRNPFERLLSAFKNKLERPLRGSRYFQQRIGRDIIRQYRANATRVSVERADDVTFEEFAMYLVEHYVPAFNEHWKPISELCFPCLLRYDFVGKYETLQNDAHFLLRAINRSEIRFPRVRRSNATSQIARYFATLSPQIISRLYNIFVLDFKLFGYSTESILGYEVAS